MTKGRKPTSRVERFERWCSLHKKNTLHEKSIAGRGGASLKIECIQCRRDRQNKGEKNKKLGLTPSRKFKKDEPKRPICTGCFLELPTSGICDNC